MCYQNLKVLAWITKKFKILTILGPPRAFFGGPKSKIGLLEDFCIGEDYSFWKYEHSSSKTVGGVRENAQNRQKNGAQTGAPNQKIPTDML